MTKSKRSHPERDFTRTHPNAAAIDIGSRMHVAAVPPDRDAEPVRTFGTCTGDLHLLADWFERWACGRWPWSPPGSTGYLPTRRSSNADSR
jgi:hypothetical protein